MCFWKKCLWSVSWEYNFKKRGRVVLARNAKEAIKEVQTDNAKYWQANMPANNVVVVYKAVRKKG